MILSIFHAQSRVLLYVLSPLGTIRELPRLLVVGRQLPSSSPLMPRLPSLEGRPEAFFRGLLALVSFIHIYLSIQGLYRMCWGTPEPAAQTPDAGSRCMNSPATQRDSAKWGWAVASPSVACAVPA